MDHPLSQAEGSRNCCVKGQGLKQVVTVGIYISIIVAFILARGATTPTYLLYLGLSLIVLGIIIRQYSILILGRYFTLSVKVASDQKVVSKGPYKYIRHPSYLGILVTECRGWSCSWFLGGNHLSPGCQRLSNRIPHPRRGGGARLGTW